MDISITLDYLTYYLFPIYLLFYILSIIILLLKVIIDYIINYLRKYHYVTTSKLTLDLYSCGGCTKYRTDDLSGVYCGHGCCRNSYKCLSLLQIFV